MDNLPQCANQEKPAFIEDEQIKVIKYAKSPGLNRRGLFGRSIQIQFFVHKEVHQEIPGDRHDEIDERQKTQQTVGTFRKLYHADAGKGKIDEVQNVIEGTAARLLCFLATR